jgi:hypothetical protein
MEMSKEYFLSLIQEEHSEIDEWSKVDDPKSEKYQELVRTGQLTGQKGNAQVHLSKGRASSDFIKDANGVVIGFKQWDYKHDKKIATFHVCGGEDEVRRILDENPDLIQQLKEEFTDTPLRWTKVKQSIACLKEPSRRRSLDLHPLPGEEGKTITGMTKKPAEKSISVQQKMKKIVYDMVDKTIGDENEEASARLIKCSVPVIHGSDVHYINRHVNEWTNNEFVYQTMNSNLYDSGPTFLRDALKKAQTNDVEINFIEKPLKRVMSKQMKWSEYQGANINKYGQETQYSGTTPFYGFDSLNFTEKNLQVVVKSSFVIKGKITSENTYRFKITFQISFGDKANALLKKEAGIRELKLNRTLVVERDINLEGTNTNFNDSYTVLDNPLIHQSLQDGLNEMREKFFKELKPVQAIAMAQVRTGRLAEMVDKITKQIMKD